MGILSDVDTALTNMDLNMQVVGTVYEEWKLRNISEYYQIGQFYEHDHNINFYTVVNKIFENVEFDTVFDYLNKMPEEAFNLSNILIYFEWEFLNHEDDRRYYEMFIKALNTIYSIPLEKFNKALDYLNIKIPPGISYILYNWPKKNMPGFVTVRVENPSRFTNIFRRVYIEYENYNITLLFEKRNASA